MSEANTEKEVNNYFEDDQLISGIVSDAVLAFEGVSRLVGNIITENITKTVFGDSSVEGVRITREDNKLIISVYINVYYGTNIPQLSYDLQKKIKKAVEQKLNVNVQTVNLSVEGIDRAKV